MTALVKAKQRFYTSAEVAEMLQVSVYPVRRLIWRQRLGCVQVTSRLWRVPSKAIERYIREELDRGQTPWQS